MSSRPALLVCIAALGRVAAAQPAEGEHDAMAAGPLGLADARDGSGTAWQPDSTPMFMWHARAGGWRFALHANVFVGYDAMAGERGDDELAGIHWLMASAMHSLGSGDVTARAMLSLEPATVGASGYPLLLQTGETFEGKPLHDRQHPHDLFMELALRYRQPIADTFGFELYLAAVGAPAIGPVAYPHRFTAMANPLAPLGHHWFDSTHITFGNLTAGVFTERVKLEGSWFYGREPDENRWNFDFWLPDSYAARLSVNPTRAISAQASWAYLASPEWQRVDVSVHRFTATVTWNRRLRERGGDLAVMVGAGENHPSLGRTTRALLVEGAAMFADRHTAFTRVEALTKSGDDLVLPAPLDDDVFAIGSLSAGYVYDFSQLGCVVPGIGVVGVLDVIGARLADFYDTRVPVGGMVYLRVRPPAMKSDAHRGHSM